jgi:uncharacterized protein (TIGR00297 family)
MNITGVLILLLVIGLVFLFTEKMVKYGRNNALVGRKLLHITGVGGLAISPAFFHNYWLIAAVSGFFGIILYFAVKRKLLATDLYHRESLGIALFPFAFLVLWLFWGRSAPHLVIYPMLILAISDAAAAIFGGLFGQKRYRVSGDEKSFLGSFAFVMATFFSLWFLPGFLEGLNPIFRLELARVKFISDRIIILLLISLVAAGFEGATSGGWDNVTVPFSVAWLLAVLPAFHSSVLNSSLPVLAGLAGLGIFAWQKKWLNTGGSVTAAILGFVIWIGGSWQALILIGLFFLTGSLLGKLNKEENVAAKGGNARDYRQVLCNGAVAGACMVWYGITQDNLAIHLFAISVAISTADTWSSETGIWAKGKVVDIIGFKPLPVGISGGVSLTGTLAGLAGAGFIGFIAWFMMVDSATWVIIFGFLGMVADSVAGSLLQARYSEGALLADAKPEGENYALVKGYLWMDNDLVNLLSNLFVTILAGFLLYFCA